MSAAIGQSHQRLYGLQKILSFYGSQLPVIHRRFTAVKENALLDNLKSAVSTKDDLNSY